MPPAALDSVEAYTRHLRTHPDDENASAYRQRVAQLEFVQARTRLRPVFGPGAMFAADPDAEPFAMLGQGVQMVFESEAEGWMGFQVVRIAPELGMPVSVFSREGKPVSMRPSQDAGQSYFSVQEPAGIALVNTASFEAQIHQLGTVGGGRAGGMRFCFFSQAPEQCEDGYEFSYDSAHFQRYELARRSGGQSVSLCGYQMDPNSAGHSDSITLNPSTHSLRNPQVEISAHHGHLIVTFNGRQLCHIQDASLTEGYFVLADTPAITRLDIYLNAGSAPIYAPAHVLADVPQAGEPLTPREHPLYQDYDAFVADYNAYLATLQGADFPESFHHSYFESFFGSAEAKEAYLAIAGSQKIEDYLAYLEAYPRNPYKSKIEKALYSLAQKKDSIEAYQAFLGSFPTSVARLDVKRRLGDLQWSKLIKKTSSRSLKKYLSQFPDGYYARRAELLLEGLEYRAQYKAEVNEARQVIAAAQKAVDRSPVTSAWNVQIIDYQAGSIYYNLSGGPALGGTSAHLTAVSEMFQIQEAAYVQTCDLLEKNRSEIGFCVFLWSQDHFDALQPIPLHEAMADALNRFYLARLKRGEAVDLVRLLELLDQMVELKANREYEAATMMIALYSRLGMLNEAAHTLYMYALAVKKPSHVKSFVEARVKDSPQLAQHPDVQWILKRLVK